MFFAFEGVLVLRWLPFVTASFAKKGLESCIFVTNTQMEPTRNWKQTRVTQNPFNASFVEPRKEDRVSSSVLQPCKTMWRQSIPQSTKKSSPTGTNEMEFKKFVQLQMMMLCYQITATTASKVPVLFKCKILAHVKYVASNFDTRCINNNIFRSSYQPNPKRVFNVLSVPKSFVRREQSSNTRIIVLNNLQLIRDNKLKVINKYPIPYRYIVSSYGIDK